eukprot:jgi/Pico_ML_1/53868/g4338.t1
MASESGRKRRRWDADGVAAGSEATTAAPAEDKAAKAQALKAKIEARLQRIKAKDPKEIVLVKDASEAPVERRKEGVAVERDVRQEVEDPLKLTKKEMKKLRTQRRLDNPQHKFKVDVNARENRLTGVCLITSDMVLVVVEGVPKAIKSRAGPLPP